MPEWNDKLIDLSFSSPLTETTIDCTAAEYNITYVMPELEGGYLIMTRIMSSRFFVLTSYLYHTCHGHDDMPLVFQKHYFRFYLIHAESNHCLEMHRRNDPFATHMHMGLNYNLTPETITPLLYYILLHAPQKISNSNTIKQFLKAIDFLVKKPYEPGVWFKNGHYALKNGYNSSDLYPHGPFKVMPRQ